MVLRCLGTGSSGNCYLLSAEAETLILDCGLPIREIKKGLDWDISKVVGVCVTHQHLDHAKAVKDFENMGIRTVKFYEIEDWNDERMKYYCVGFGDFIVKPFPLPHNGTINYGFYIMHRKTDDKILYLTDFEYCKYNFKSLQVNHIICECNYQQELVSRDLANYEHKIRGHCSLETCKSFIAANKTNALRTVILCHMGAETLDFSVAKEQVQEVVGNSVKVEFATAGLETKLSLTPF